MIAIGASAPAKARVCKIVVILAMVFEQGFGKLCHVACGGDLSVIWQAGGVEKTGLGEAETAGLNGH